MTTTNPFQKATKRKAKLRLALAGPPGSGKTYTALRLAHLLGYKRIAYIDTENDSASKYVGEAPDGIPFDFDAISLSAPYHPDRYVDLMRAAADAGYDCVIVDSMAHAWSGSGGMIELVDKRAAQRSDRNGFAAWGDVKPVERRLWDAVVQSPINVIACFRTKVEWVIEENDRGKKTPRKIGTKMEQREGVEYEFDVVVEFDDENRARVTKTRCPKIRGEVYQPAGKDLAAALSAWLDDGAPMEAAYSPQIGATLASGNPPSRRPEPPPIEIPKIETTWPESIGSKRALGDALEARGWKLRDVAHACGNKPFAEWGADECKAVAEWGRERAHLNTRRQKRIDEARAAGRLDEVIAAHGKPATWDHPTCDAIKALLGTGENAPVEAA